MREIWKPVRGHRGLYEVSSLGAVRSLARKMLISRRDEEPHFRRIVAKTRHIFLWRHGSGYWTVRLSRDRKTKTRYVHALVAEAFLGFKRLSRSGLQVNHKDGDKTNNRARNLEYVTHKENAQHYHALREAK